MKRIISISLAVLILISCFVISAGAVVEFNYSIRIEGVNANLYYGEWTMSNNADKPIECTVAEALKNVNDADDCKIEVKGLEDGYVTEINGEKAGKFGGYDGWYYSVNGEAPSVGMADYKLKDGDSIVIYYGDYPCQIPVIDASKSGEGVLKVQSYDTDWSTGSPVSAWAPVSGATLYVGYNKYTTDSNGIVDLGSKSYSGKVPVQIDKKSAAGAPQVCRFASDYTLDINYTPANPEPEQKTQVSSFTDKSLYVGQSMKIIPVVKFAKGNTSFISDRKSIASVSSDGIVKAHKKGTATITVKNNGVSSKFKITVKNPKLNRKKISLKKGGSFKIKITGKNGKQTFKSSKKSVAKVSKSGKVTAKKKGKATITVKTNGSVKLTLKVTVK